MKCYSYKTVHLIDGIGAQTWPSSRNVWQSREPGWNSSGHGGDHGKEEDESRGTSFSLFSSFPWGLAFPLFFLFFFFCIIFWDDWERVSHSDRCVARRAVLRRRPVSLRMLLTWATVHLRPSIPKGGGEKWTFGWTNILSRGDMTLF